MTAEIVIRPERPDQPEVAALLAALDAYLHALYAPEANHIIGIDALLQPDVSFFVARRDGRAVGTGAVRRHGGVYGEIKRMYVVPEQRGRRIAEQLLGMLEQSLRDDGITTAMLETGGEQTAALRLYERCGYRRSAPFGSYPENGLSVFLSKSL